LFFFVISYLVFVIIKPRTDGLPSRNPSKVLKDVLQQMFMEMVTKRCLRSTLRRYDES